MRDLNLRVVLLAARGGVATTDHGDSACRCHLDDRVHHALGALLERSHLEHPHRSVPDDRLRALDRCLVQLDGLRPAIETHHTILHAGFKRGGLDGAILAELGGGDEIHGEHKLHTFACRFLHDLRDDLGAILIEQRAADGEVLGYLQEGERHAPTNDHLVHFVQQVLDEQNLVAHLCAAKDGEHRLHRRIEDLGECSQLLGYQHAGRLHGVAFTHHG
mmetsp:Transcript_4754/g.12017  ORF Transcript_4754/g.12017 Transcript_4754/m.12017 type:complete len:218 (+) Transcript_4754:525-1178(+)